MSTTTKAPRPAVILPIGAKIIEDNQRTPETGSAIFIRCSKPQVFAYVNGLAGKGFWENTELPPIWADKSEGSFTKYERTPKGWVPDFSARYWIALA